MDLSPISQNLNLLTSFGLAKGLNTDPQQALFIKAMQQGQAKQALSVLKIAAQTDAPNETTKTLRENLTKYFEAVASGESTSGEAREVQRPARLDGLVDRVIHGSLPYNDKQAFISQVARDIQEVPSGDQTKFIDDAIKKLVEQEISNPKNEEATPAEETRLKNFYEGLMESLASAAKLGLGGLGSGLFLDFKG